MTLRNSSKQRVLVPAHWGFILQASMLLCLIGCSRAGDHVAAGAPAARQTTQADAARTPLEIETPDLSARLYLPDTPDPQPVILVIGGSEGGLRGSGKLAQSLANAGFAALAVAYFDHQALPAQLMEIPLERFDTALAWLRAEPRVLGTRIGIVGVSKGAEAALLVASVSKHIAAVVAASPSNVVWQAIDQTNWSERSSWTRGGVPLEFVRYDFEGPMWPLLDMYARSLAASDRLHDASIPVAEISAPLLLISGSMDQLWPSTDMGKAVVETMRAGGRTAVTHLRYADAGHSVFGKPFDPAKVDSYTVTGLGGSVGSNLAARVDGWPRVLTFLNANLRPSPTTERAPAASASP